MSTAIESWVWSAYCEARQYPIYGTGSNAATFDIPGEVASRLLKPSAGITRDGAVYGADLLNAVRALDGWTADRLTCRDTSLSDFKFRGIHCLPKCKENMLPSKGEAPDTTKMSSYIAVSYCWHYDTWAPALGLQSTSVKSARGQKPPLMPAMFAAILEERASEVEPLWIDQYCIDQSSENEKAVAIGMMDLLYSNARVVTVCLEDVRLSVKDMAILVDFGTYLREKTMPFLENGWEIEELEWGGKEGHLFEAVTKIFTARWFSRAWCVHEYWMGRHHVFLAPVTANPTTAVSDDAATTIIRFNSAFLGTAYLLTSRWIPGDKANSVEKMVRHCEEHVKHSHPYFHARIFDFDASQLGTRAVVTHSLKYFGGFKAKRMVPLHQQTFAVVNALGSYSPADKLAITLNVGQIGLKLNLPGNASLSSAEIAWMATIIALASGDATVLASTGPSILSLGNVGLKHDDEYGWANVPEIDRVSRIEEQEKQTSLPVEISKHGLGLDVIRLGKSSQIQKPDPIKKNLGIVAIEWLHERDKQNLIFLGNGLRRRHLASSLGCLITGGASWTIACAMSLQLHPTSPLFDLNVAQNMHLIDSAFKALDRLALLPDSSDPTVVRLDLEGSKEILDEKHRDGDIMPGLWALLTVADGLLRTVVGEEIEYQENEISETHQIQVCVSNIAGHGGIVIFGPPAGEVKYELVCPNILRKTSQKHTNMRKGWILQENPINEESMGHSTGKLPQTYRLLCKTPLFMPLAVDTDDPFSIYNPERIVVGHS